MKILTKCHNETIFTEKPACSANPIGGKIEYQIKVETKKCFNGETAVILQISGLKDNVSALMIGLIGSE